MAQYLSDDWFTAVSEALGHVVVVDTRVTIQQTVTDGPDGEVTWVVDIDERGIHLTRGAAAEPSASITQSYATAARLNGQPSTPTGDPKAPSWPNDPNSPTGKVEAWSQGGGAPWQTPSFDIEAQWPNNQPPTHALQRVAVARGLAHILTCSDTVAAYPQSAPTCQRLMESFRVR